MKAINLFYHPATIFILLALFCPIAYSAMAQTKIEVEFHNGKTKKYFVEADRHIDFDQIKVFDKNEKKHKFKPSEVKQFEYNNYKYVSQLPDDAKYKQGKINNSYFVAANRFYKVLSEGVIVLLHGLEEIEQTMQTANGEMTKKTKAEVWYVIKENHEILRITDTNSDELIILLQPFLQDQPPIYDKAKNKLNKIKNLEDIIRLYNRAK